MAQAEEENEDSEAGEEIVYEDDELDDEEAEAEQ